MTYAGSPSAAAGATPAGPAAPAAGEVFAGRYRLLQLLPGQDATAQTWHALDEVLARPVAVRAVPADEPRSVAFLAAAAQAGALQNRLTTRVYDAAVESRPHGPAMSYVVSEWVSGPWLADAVTEGPLPPEQAVELVSQATESLAAAHDAGVVHGRLHPGNVLLEAGSRLRFADTAVAAALHGDPSGPDDDVRALAAVLYALLTARWPASCTPQPARGLAEAPTNARGTCAPSQVRAGVPRALDRLVVSALAAGPAGRTAPALLQALDQAAAASGSSRPGRRAHRRPLR